MKQSCRITCLVPASQPSLPPPVSTADGQQAQMAAVSADTEASGRRHKRLQLQINILTLAAHASKPSVSAESAAKRPDVS